MEPELVLSEGGVNDETAVISRLLDHAESALQRNESNDPLEVFVSSDEKLAVPQHEIPLHIAHLLILFHTLADLDGFGRQYYVIRDEFQVQIGSDVLVDVRHLRFLLLFLDVVIVWTVDAFDFEQRLLVLVHGEIDHFYDEVSLQWKSSKIANRLRVVLKLDDEFVILESLYDLLHHGDVVRPAVVVLLPDIQRVVDEVQLDHARVTDLLCATLIILLNRK